MLKHSFSRVQLGCSILSHKGWNQVDTGTQPNKKKPRKITLAFHSNGFFLIKKGADIDIPYCLMVSPHHAFALLVFRFSLRCVSVVWSFERPRRSLFWFRSNSGQCPFETQMDVPSRSRWSNSSFCFPDGKSTLRSQCLCLPCSCALHHGRKTQLSLLSLFPQNQRAAELIELGGVIHLSFLNSPRMVGPNFCPHWPEQSAQVFPFFFVNGAAALVGVRCRTNQGNEQKIDGWCKMLGRILRISHFFDSFSFSAGGIWLKYWLKYWFTLLVLWLLDSL